MAATSDHDRAAKVAEANVPMTEGLRRLTRFGLLGHTRGKQLESTLSRFEQARRVGASAATNLIDMHVNAGKRVLWIDADLELKPAQRNVETGLFAELEIMLALSPEDITRFKWRNAHSVRGWVSTPLHLLDLVRLVGASHEWTYVVVNDLGHDDNAYAQCAGSSVKGYVVEIGIRDKSYVVARRGQMSSPPMDVGTHGWTYWARGDELHEDKVAASIMWDWLSARISPDGRDLHRADWRLPPGARI